MSVIYRIFVFALLSLSFVLAAPNVSAQTQDHTQDIQGIDIARDNYAAALKAKGKIPLDSVWLNWRIDDPEIFKAIKNNTNRILVAITNCTSPVFNGDDQAAQDCDDKTSYMGRNDAPKFRRTFIFSKLKDGTWVLKSRLFVKKY